MTDREPVPSPEAPWPVKRGGIWPAIYKNSLSFAFAFLFVISFWLHFAGSFKDYNEEQMLKGNMQNQYQITLQVPIFGLNRFKTGKVNFWQLHQ